MVKSGNPAVITIPGAEATGQPGADHSAGGHAAIVAQRDKLALILRGRHLRWVLSRRGSGPPARSVLTRNAIPPVTAYRRPGTFVLSRGEFRLFWAGAAPARMGT